MIPGFGAEVRTKVGFLVIGLLAAFLAVVACTQPAMLTTTAPLPDGLRGTVVAVASGDTIIVRLASGQEEEVCLIGIKAPETGQDCSRDATQAIAALLEGKEVALETDVETRDRYDRLLAYVWTGPAVTDLANAEMLRMGMATLQTVPPNVKYVDMLQSAQD
jgi:micrococcal nuclease